MLFFTNFFYLLYFFFAAIILTISPRHFWLRILSIIAASVGIIVFGLGASDLIAQDRSAYFNMYQNAVPDRAFYEDIIFNYFLIILPDSLTENAFFFVLNSISLSLLFATLFLLSREFSISFYLLLIVFSIILVDRIWFDLMFNTLRSTWAIMLFICAICSKSSLLKLILFIASLGVHFFAGMGMFILYLFSHLLILKPKSLILLATFCIIMFLYIGFSDFNTPDPFILINNRFRIYGYILVVIFHIMTSIMFPIGVFPLVMICSTLIFFSEDFHSKIIHLISKITLNPFSIFSLIELKGVP